MGRRQQPDDRKRYIEGLDRFQERRQMKEPRQPAPWLWLGLGVVVTLVGLVLAFVLVTLLLSREPLSTSLPTPTIIRLTARPSAIPSPTPPANTPTPIPTFTPPPTPDLSIAPEEVTVGYYARVVNTDGVGVILRGGPSTDNIRIQLLDEGSVLLVVDGPEEGNEFSWWQVRLADGVEGWIASDFLSPASAPEES